MITIYPPGCTDFSSNGLGVLTPYTCKVKKVAAGAFEMEMEHPIDNTLRWAQITAGCVIKVPTPVRENPLYEIEAFEGVETETTTVSRAIYKVQTSGARLHLRKRPSLSAKILGSYRPGTEVVKLKTSGSWMKVSVRKGGATGWMWSSCLQKVRDITETISKAKPITREGVRVQPSRDQLFRVNSVEVDTADAVVTAKCTHVFYDLRGNLINAEYEPEKVPANTAVEYIAGHLLNETEHTFSAPNLTAKISGSYSYKSPVEALLDPDDGIVAQSGAMLVRDDFDVYLLPDMVRDMGVTVRRGKNLAGVVVTTDASDIVTRIIPVGKDKKGNDLFLTGTRYVDSSRINDYPEPMAQRREYDVKLVDKSPDNETTFTNATAARNKLAALAQADFDDGADLPSYSMEVDFELLEYAEGYEDYAELQSIHLYDTVTVIDEMIGLSAKVRVTGYEWDALTERYTSVTLGDLQALSQTVYSYNLPTGGISGTKIVNNSLPGTAIRNLSVEYAKIAVAAIEQLTANSLTATQAHIQELAAGRITTDELYASLAQIAAAEIGEAAIDHANVKALAAAVAQIAAAQIEEADIETARITDAQVETLAAALAIITRADIETAEVDQALIDWAGINNLTAQAAAIAKAGVGSATISSANIGWAAIQSVSAQLAELAQARIDQATITQAQIDRLHSEVVETIALTAQNANFDFASAQRLVASAMILEQGVGGSVTIGNLTATSAMFVQATMGSLTLKGDDGDYYDVTVTADGSLHTERVEPTAAEIAAGQMANGRKIVETEADIAELNAGNIRAQSAVVSEIFTAALTAEKISASEAFVASATIPELRVAALKAVGDTLDISANQSVSIAVGAAVNEVVGDIVSDMETLNSDVESAQAAAEEAMDAVQNLVVGCVNLVDNSEQITITGTDDPETSFRELASGLLPGMAYTLSMESATLTAGSAAGMTLEGVRLPDADLGETEEVVFFTRTLDFSGGKQQTTFITADDGHTYALRLYAGIKGASNGVTVELEKVKLEEGTLSTMWTESRADAEARLASLVSQLNVTRTGLEDIVTHVTRDVDGTIRDVNSYFRFDGSDPQNPKLILGSSDSPMTMELTNNRLSFLWRGDTVAYFSDNKLYVTNVEAIQRMSIGVSSNGYLDIVTTATGVGFLWRA